MPMAKDGDPPPPLTLLESRADALGSRRKLSRYGQPALTFIVTSFVSALIGAVTIPPLMHLWSSIHVARAADERYCTFSNESDVREGDTSFRIKTVDGPSYFPSVCTNKQSANRGETISYGLRVTNNGSDDLPSFLVANQLPDGVTYKQGSSRASVEGSDEIVLADNWLQDGINLGGLGIGESRVIFFQVDVNNDAVDGQLLENTGQFQRLDQTGWMQCAVTSRVKIPL